MIENAGDIFYLFTAGIERKEHYRAVVSIASSDKGVVEAKMSNFSKFKCFNSSGNYIKIMYIQVHLKFKTVMYTLTTLSTYLWSVHLPSTQQHQGLY